MSEKLKKKTFCKWEKEDIKENISVIYDLTAKPKYVCQNCARVAKQKVNLCKPYEFKKSDA
ncbi:MAG: hypothetical protein M0036_05195 [Desulfobacteraceae bacterium]|nr:hypothetical protein [Desulfobacteraceae bacterium]